MKTYVVIGFPNEQNFSLVFHNLKPKNDVGEVVVVITKETLAMWGGVKNTFPHILKKNRVRFVWKSDFYPAYDKIVVDNKEFDFDFWRLHRDTFFDLC